MRSTLKVVPVCVAAVMMVLAGCRGGGGGGGETGASGGPGGCRGGGGGDEQTASSGDPEADRRAEMRVGSGGDRKDNGKAPVTLYERLGGQRGITALVEDMTARVVADPRVNFERQNIKSGIL